jgi:hypothetical protein
MPRLVACGGRESTFDDFVTAHTHAAPTDYIAMWIDSEDPISDPELAWEHLERRDSWRVPDGADNDQVLLMVTSMETWVVSDHASLKRHFGQEFNGSSLPALDSIESCHRNDILKALETATSRCKRGYRKGKSSFEVLGQLEPAVLCEHLSSFTRCVRLLKENL